MGANYGNGNYGVENYSSPEIMFSGSLVAFTSVSEDILERTRLFFGSASVSVAVSGTIGYLSNLSGSVVATFGFSAAAEFFREMRGRVTTSFSLRGNILVNAVFAGQVHVEPVVSCHLASDWADTDIDGTWENANDPSGPWINNSDPAGAWNNG